MRDSPFGPYHNPFTPPPEGLDKFIGDAVFYVFMGAVWVVLASLVVIPVWGLIALIFFS